MGFYEEGMELQEMRHILDALQMSINDEENKILDCDIQQALKVSFISRKVKALFKLIDYVYGIG